ncbi:MAG: hypothetical protein ABI168_10290 [Ginsengibacter sp.]
MKTFYVNVVRLASTSKTYYMQVLRKSVFLFTLLIMTGVSSFGQRQSEDSLSTVVKAIANNNVYEVSLTVGYAGTISEQLKRFDLLLSLTTNDQLLDIAGHNKNAVVRLYAFQALKRKKIEMPKILIQQFLNDSTIVETLNGCIADKKSVNTLAQQNIKSLSELSN